jgi:hypothetical protein
MKKIDKKIFQQLREKLKPEELSTNKGKIEVTKFKKFNSKVRRHKGREEIFIDDEDYPYQEWFYNSWNEFRDGFRDINAIKTKEKKKELRKEREIRKLKKK